MAISAVPSDAEKAIPPTAIPNIPPPRRGSSLQSSQNVIAGAGQAQQITGLYNNYAPLAYMLPWMALDYIEQIAQYNQDYSQAIDNIVTLANSGYNMVVLGPKRTSQRMHNQLTLKSRTVMAEHGGFEGLIDKLLRQAATYGAMCGEWLLSPELDDVVGFADINPKFIRFFWEDNHWAPYQKVGFLQMQEAIASNQVTRAGSFVKLNEITFHYYGFNAAPMSPYGTPPFLAALPHIATQQDMLFNMAQVVRKIGMLGIVDIVIDQLQRLPGEDQSQFTARAEKYVEQYAEAMDDMMTRGGIAHFNDAEVKATNIGGNAAGATNIFKQNEELLFSGLKSMPSVQGRSYSTTETYAGVAYDIIIRNTRKYQDSVKAMMEKGFWLMAAMWGETPQDMNLDFLPNKTLHRLEDAKSLGFEIDNAMMLWVMGIYDQTTASHSLGYGDPLKEVVDAPSDNPIFGGKPGVGKADPATGGDNPPTAGDTGSSKAAFMDDDQWQEMMARVEELVEERFRLQPS